ncbi:MAG: hypothetical protein LH470_03325 [Lysobacter sp.]|nr:hypothetical protein [Lysobacter sp.]
MTHTRLILALTLALTSTAAWAAPAQDIEKINGSISAEAGQTVGNMETVNGSIRIGTGARTRNAETVNGSITVAERAQVGDMSTVNGSVRVAQNVQIGGSVETVNGSVFVDRGGTVRGDVTTVNGAIGLVDTDLAGSIATVNGNITVGPGSHVKGDIKVEKPSSNWMPISIGKRKPPRIVIAANAIVEGPLVFEREVKLYVHQSAKIGSVTGATAVRYSGDRAPAD